MADLVEIAFPSEAQADRVRQKLLDMQQEYLVEIADAVIAEADQLTEAQTADLAKIGTLSPVLGFWVHPNASHSCYGLT